MRARIDGTAILRRAAPLYSTRVFFNAAAASALLERGGSAGELPSGDTLPDILPFRHARISGERLGSLLTLPLLLLLLRGGDVVLFNCCCCCWYGWCCMFCS